MKEMGPSVMAVSEQEQQVASIKNLIKEKSFHSYFRQHIGTPDLDDDRILMLSVAMNQIDLPISDRELYITTAMLVQLALDTHEQVADPDATLKERQLRVLAGDFYSGLYYSQLANLKNTDLIRSLATAIKTVNEHKISINQTQVNNIDSFINSCKIVESKVMEQFCLHFNATTYIGLFSELLFLKKMTSELEKYNSGDRTVFYENLKKSSSLAINGKKKVRQVFVHYMAESQKRMEDFLHNIPSLPPLLRSRLNEVTARYRSCVEES